MSGQSFYSAARARRSLLHFLMGKLTSAVTGIACLVWVVRQVPASDYGLFVALLALLELFYLASGLGLSTMAQRYVAEFRMQAPAPQFRRFLLGLLWRRFGLALAGAVLVGLAWPALAAVLRIEALPATRWWLVAWLVVGSCTRYLDEVLPALLMQGVSQFLGALSNVLRLLALAALGHAGMALGHLELVRIELALSVVSGLLGLGLLFGHLRQHATAGEGLAEHHNVGMWGVSRRFYAVQLLGQVWGPNMARLLIARLAGVALTALFGFCHALVDMLRNYLPSYLLANWVRPLMVSRYMASQRLGPVLDMAGAVFKLSLITLAPFLGLLAVHGDALARWISAGRYGTGAGALMAALVVVLALQSLHTGLTMVCATLERASANVWATAACCLALPLAWLLWRQVGLMALPLALGLAEGVWITWVALALRRAGFSVRLDIVGIGKVLLAGGAAAGVTLAWPAAEGPALLLPALAAGLTMVLMCVWLRPLSEGERELLAQVLPRRWLWL